MDESGAACRISSLPDHLLHLVLQRLRCARAAARTSILSRRWRSVYSCFPEVVVDVTLHDVPLRSLEAALLRAAGPRVRLLDIRVPGNRVRFVAATTVSSVLRAAAALAPVELRLSLTQCVDWTKTQGPSVVELPRFLRATSIQLHGLLLDLSFADCAGFPLLERLSLSGCDLDLAALIPCCPRLQALTVDDFTVHSASLHQLLVKRMKKALKTGRLHPRDVAHRFIRWPKLPMLAGGERRWCHSYPKVTYGLGLWGLLEVGLKSTCVEVLSLHICAQDSFSFRNAQFRFGEEIAKHVITHFSTLNLHLTTAGHVFGAFVLRLLGMICLRDTKNLNIILSTSEVKEACPPNCRCDDPEGWRTENVSLNLKEVKIEGFKGEDHEFDFLEAVLKCSPMLKSLTVRLPDQDMPSDDWCTKIHNIFGEYPFVEGNIDLVSG
ncbi:hypothetical protein ZWY2020_051526 [Hordeum vulgare]|nr:hypothetical protein ZWY2020_051526 [Hordeum vulgare]